jgi:hypothetical protein
VATALPDHQVGALHMPNLKSELPGQCSYLAAHEVLSEFGLDRDRKLFIAEVKVEVVHRLKVGARPRKRERESSNCTSTTVNALVCMKT